MLFSLFEFVDIFLQKRRSVTAAIACAFAVLLISLLAPILQAHRTSIAAQIQASYADQSVQSAYDGPNVVTNAFSQMANNIGRDSDSLKIKTLNTTMRTATTITHVDKDTVHATATVTAFTFHGISFCAFATIHAVRYTFAFTGHTIGNTFGSIFGFFSGLSHLSHMSSLIRPPDSTPTPTITQIRAQQAAIIQSGTKGVAVPAALNGTGGACDNGEGNGGYPMSWCNAPMDTISTIFYSSDPINRECTSYAYWYFTTIEGNANFHVWGNAKYWATTSNYSTHALPVDGAIAVETAGAYGHVAIVQALPGQQYAGQVVPAGYVLVSEMNYDWQGHFRYSYSPLSKFSAYIYPQ